ncbi:hypothetical protein ASPNIDRAFT_45547 [Aspergillus niger ATCC 1015]|uniref:Uncharacterized protein n=1 Tax=Aspergillus niger (strain ATCC 1015 / CBS 113.46 / FGSC A1144 / LSHB Ac4 / NCTC 3858a / NRRL 328 / USDA 3528.7) TaxID=380704 RepID=G3Y6Q1_ASPNA|nr:hypothetical protein ASPNIDRAFT_45547 [Aspergillus niger ATCC 1015]
MYSWNVGQKKEKRLSGGVKSNLAHIARYAIRRTRTGWERKPKRNQTDNVNALSHKRGGNTDNGMLQDRGKGMLGEKGNESKARRKVKKGFEEKGPEPFDDAAPKEERAAPRAIRGSESRGGASSAGKLSTAKKNATGKDRKVIVQFDGRWRDDPGSSISSSATTHFSLPL